MNRERVSVCGDCGASITRTSRRLAAVMVVGLVASASLLTAGSAAAGPPCAVPRANASAVPGWFDSTLAAVSPLYRYQPSRQPVRHETYNYRYQLDLPWHRSECSAPPAHCEACQNRSASYRGYVHEYRVDPRRLSPTPAGSHVPVAPLPEEPSTGQSSVPRLLVPKQPQTNQQNDNSPEQSANPNVSEDTSDAANRSTIRFTLK